MFAQFTALLLMVSFVSYGDRPTNQPQTYDGDPHRARLGNVLDEVSYVGEDLEDALANLAEEAGFNLVVDWPALEAIAIYGDTRIDLSLKSVTVTSALEAILHLADRRHLGAAFTIRDGLLAITSKAVLDRQLDVRVYNGAPLFEAERTGMKQPTIGASAEPWRPLARIGSLRWRREMRSRGLPPYTGPAEAIQGTVDPSSWERHGGPGSLRLLGDKLVVRQTQTNHAAIERLLNDLSRSSMNDAGH